MFLGYGFELPADASSQPSSERSSAVHLWVVSSSPDCGAGQLCRNVSAGLARSARFPLRCPRLGIMVLRQSRPERENRHANLSGGLRRRESRLGHAAQGIRGRFVVELLGTGITNLGRDVFDDTEPIPEPDGGADEVGAHRHVAARAEFGHHNLMSFCAASAILGASGRIHEIIDFAPGPGASGNAILATLAPGTFCAISATTCEPKPLV